MRLKMMFCALMGLLTVCAHAQEASLPVWSGDASLAIAASNSTSNSNSTASVAGGLVWQPSTCTNTGAVNRYKVSLKAGEYQTVNDHVTTSQEIDASLRLEATVYRHLRGYTAEVYYRDPFSGVEHQFATEVGGLLQAVKTKKVSLDLSLAVSPTWQERTNDTHRFIGATWGTNFSYEVDNRITLQELFVYNYDFSNPRNWKVSSYTEVKLLLYKSSLGLKGSYWTGIKGGQLQSGKPLRTSYLTAGLTYEFSVKPKK